MPIYDLVPADLDGRLPEIGRLRKGEPYDPAAGKAPVETDYFRFTANNENDVELVELFRQLYGNKPKVIDNVFLAYSNVDSAFDAWNKEYVTSGLKRMCDGRNIALQWDDEGQVLHSWMDMEETKRPKCEKPTGCNCRPVGTLHLWIPALERIGSVVLPTSSVNDIKNILGTLRFINKLAQQNNGNLRNIPMRLTRYPKEIPVSYVDRSGKKVRSKATKHLVRLEPSPEWVKSKMVNSVVELPAHPPELDAPPELEPAPVPPATNVERKEEDVYVEARAAQDPNKATSQQLANLSGQYVQMGLHGDYAKYQIIFTKIALCKPVTTLQELTQKEATNAYTAAFALSAIAPRVTDIVKIIDDITDLFKTGHATTENFVILDYLRALEKELMPDEPAAPVKTDKTYENPEDDPNEDLPF